MPQKSPTLSNIERYHMERQAAEFDTYQRERKRHEIGESNPVPPLIQVQSGNISENVPDYDSGYGTIWQGQAAFAREGENGDKKDFIPRNGSGEPPESLGPPQQPEHVLQPPRKQGKGKWKGQGRNIHGVRQPSLKQIEDAKMRYDYQDGKFHCCITGTSGTGKSSLVNALRGFGDKERDSAQTGTSETSETLKRYPDNREAYSRFVWYDVPGAGTPSFPKKRYFYQQGLFIFDFVIVVFGSRIMQADVYILKKCEQFGIPAFVVRSKSNAHISNMANSQNIDYDQARDRYVSDTRAYLAKELAEAGLNLAKHISQYCYIVSSHDLRNCVSNPATATGYIDEPKLIADLHISVEKRRYSKNEIGSETSIISDSQLSGGREPSRESGSDITIVHSIVSDQQQSYQNQNLPENHYQNLPNQHQGPPSQYQSNHYQSNQYQSNQYQSNQYQSNQYQPHQHPQTSQQSQNPQHQTRPSNFTFPQIQQTYPSPQEGNTMPNQGPRHPRSLSHQQPHPHNQQQNYQQPPPYPPSPQYPTPAQQYSRTEQQYHPAEQQHPQQYLQPKQQYPQLAQQFPQSAQQYPQSAQQYPQSAQQYPPSAQQFSPPAQQFSPPAQQFPPQGQQYSEPKAQQYPPQAQQYPPQVQQYPPQAQQYPPQAQQYPPQVQQYPPPSQQHSPTAHQYPQQYSPDSPELRQKPPYQSQNFQSSQYQTHVHPSMHQHPPPPQHQGAPFTSSRAPDIHRVSASVTSTTQDERELYSDQNSRYTWDESTDSNNARMGSTSTVSGPSRSLYQLMGQRQSAERYHGDERRYPNGQYLSPPPQTNDASVAQPGPNLYPTPSYASIAPPTTTPTEYNPQIQSQWQYQQRTQGPTPVQETSFHVLSGPGSTQRDPESNQSYQTSAISTPSSDFGTDQRNQMQENIDQNLIDSTNGLRIGLSRSLTFSSDYGQQSPIAGEPSQPEVGGEDAASHSSARSFWQRKMDKYTRVSQNPAGKQQDLNRNQPRQDQPPKAPTSTPNQQDQIFSRPSSRAPPPPPTLFPTTTDTAQRFPSRSERSFDPQSRPPDPRSEEQKTNMLNSVFKTPPAMSHQRSMIWDVPATNEANALALSGMAFSTFGFSNGPPQPETQQTTRTNEPRALNTYAVQMPLVPLKPISGNGNIRPHLPTGFPIPGTPEWARS